MRDLGICVVLFQLTLMLFKVVGQGVKIKVLRVTDRPTHFTHFYNIGNAYEIQPKTMLVYKLSQYLTQTAVTECENIRSLYFFFAEKIF